MKKLLLLFAAFLIITGSFCQVVKLKKQYYTIYFHEKQKIPLYTVYTLKKSYIVKKPRHGSFQQDAAESSDKQATDADYDDKNYDKGHFTPDADFRFSDDAEKETFLYTNAAPQWDYFNEHLWASLEGHVRNICKTYGNVKVYTGCLFSSHYLHGINIPAYFWKVIIYKKEGKKVKEGYIARNVKPASNKYSSISDTISDLQQRTGLTFQ